MAIFTQNFESGTAGTEISPANTAGGGTSIDSVKGTGSSVAFTSTAGELINSTMSCKCFGPSGSAAYANWAGSGTQGGFFSIQRLPVTTAIGAVHLIRSSGGVMCQVQLYTNKKLVVADKTGTALYTTPTALTLPGVYQIDLAVDSGTSTTDGKVKFAVYDSSGNLTGGMTSTVEVTGINAGAGGSISFFQAGKCNTITDTSNYIIDDLRAVTGSYTFASPFAGNLAPSANAGPDQTNLEPWSTVTLTGAASTDADGTVASYAWRQISGTSVTLSGTGATRTYTAPATIAGDTQVFGLTVTDNLGATSTEDTVSCTVLPVTERAVIGGVEVPMRIDEV